MVFEWWSEKKTKNLFMVKNVRLSNDPPKSFDQTIRKPDKKASEKSNIWFSGVG